MDLTLFTGWFVLDEYHGVLFYYTVSDFPPPPIFTNQSIDHSILLR